MITMMRSRCELGNKIGSSDNHERTIMRTLVTSLIAVLALSIAPEAAAKSYTAARFDSAIRILPNGSLEVAETVVFRFEGEFKYVYRELSRRRTDDIEVVSAGMDGRTLPLGSEPGQVEVRRRSNIRIEWKFAPVADSSHTFVLTYIVRGVVQRAGGRDVLEWVALPTDHDYRIDESEVRIEFPAAPSSRPIVDARRATALSLQPGNQQLQVVARGIGRNGWVRTRLEFDEGAIIAAAPAWQQRQDEARALAPRWLTAAGVLLSAGVLFMFALRQSYDRPWDAAPVEPVAALPDTLRPAVAGAVAANGGTTLQHAMATIFALADRGVVTITEEPRKWGQRRFTLQRRRSTHRLSPEEDAALTLAFRDKRAEENTVALPKARSRLAAGLGAFRRAVTQELRGLGLVDDERMRLRARYRRVSTALLILAGVLAVPAKLLVSRYGGWPFAMAGAAGLLSMIGFIFRSSLTPLSNEGARRAERWRAYRKHLKDVAREGAHLASDAPSGLLPFAVALGLAGTWSKYMKSHPTGNPPWFRALAVSGDDGGFYAFVAAGGAGADGGSGGSGAGGAAGGGGSGAG
jgi:hypothetical protein